MQSLILSLILSLLQRLRSDSVFAVQRATLERWLDAIVLDAVEELVVLAEAITGKGSEKAQWVRDRLLEYSPQVAEAVLSAGATLINNAIEYAVLRLRAG